MMRGVTAAILATLLVGACSRDEAPPLEVALETPTPSASSPTAITASPTPKGSPSLDFGEVALREICASLGNDRKVTTFKLPSPLTGIRTLGIYPRAQWKIREVERDELEVLGRLSPRRSYVEASSDAPVEGTSTDPDWFLVALPGKAGGQGWVEGFVSEDVWRGLPAMEASRLHPTGGSDPALGKPKPLLKPGDACTPGSPILQGWAIFLRNNGPATAPSSFTFHVQEPAVPYSHPRLNYRITFDFYEASSRENRSAFWQSRATVGSPWIRTTSFRMQIERTTN